LSVTDGCVADYLKQAYIKRWQTGHLFSQVPGFAPRIWKTDSETVQQSRIGLSDVSKIAGH